MRQLLLFYIMSFIVQPVFAQPLAVKPAADDEKNWSWDIQIDQRNTIYLNKNLLGTDVSAGVSGLAAGFTYQDRFRFGLGGYFSNAQSASASFITNQLYFDKIKLLAPGAVTITKKGKKGYLVNTTLNMYYVTPSFEYTFFESKWLDLSIPVEAGVGFSKLVRTDFFSDAPIPIISKTGKVLKGGDILLPAMIGFTAMINLSPDVGFAGTIGYRKILKEVGISQNFDGLYYSVGLALVPENIIAAIKKDFKDRKKKGKDKEAAK